MTTINGSLLGNFNLTNNTDIPDGKLVINLTIVDSAGFNETVILNITIDNVAPDVTISWPSNGTIFYQTASRR